MCWRMRSRKRDSRAWRRISKTCTSGSCTAPHPTGRHDMVREFFRFELRQQLRSPLFWLIAAILAGFAFAAASSDTVTIGGGVGNIHRNAPYVVITTLGIFSILG